MATPKTPTPQDIGALLRKGGLLAAGRYRDDKGYRATWADGSMTSVCVRFYGADDRIPELLASAALVLTACGCTVETESGHLTVTARKDEP